MSFSRVDGPLQPFDLLASRTHPLCVGYLLRQFGVDKDTTSSAEIVVFLVAALVNFFIYIRA